MHDFFTVRERYKHALFSVSCIVQVLEHLVTLSYIGVPVTINKHDNAVVHGISSKRVTSKGVKFEFSDYRVSMSFIIHVLDPQTFVGNQETSLGNMACPAILIFVLLTRKGCILRIINFKIILLWQ